MNAVILNSGVGRRLGELTADRPKCLLDLGGGETVLDRQLRLLAGHGPLHVIMTTGPFATRLQAHVASRFPRLAVTWVHNPLFDSTNYIYSLHLARPHIRGGGLLLHGDMVFSAAALSRLAGAPGANTVLARRSEPLPEKDFTGRIVAGRVVEIGVGVRGPGCLEIMPVYRLSAGGWSAWLDEIARWVDSGRTGVYAEDAFNRIATAMDLHPVRLGNRLCMEIDTASDLREARRRVERKR